MFQLHTKNVLLVALLSSVLLPARFAAADIADVVGQDAVDDANKEAAAHKDDKLDANGAGSDWAKSNAEMKGLRYAKECRQTCAAFTKINNGAGLAQGYMRYCSGKNAFDQKRALKDHKSEAVDSYGFNPAGNDLADSDNEGDNTRYCRNASLASSLQGKVSDYCGAQGCPDDTSDDIGECGSPGSPCDANSDDDSPRTPASDGHVPTKAEIDKATKDARDSVQPTLDALDKHPALDALSKDQN